MTGSIRLREPHRAGWPVPACALVAMLLLSRAAPAATFEEVYGLGLSAVIAAALADGEDAGNDASAPGDAPVAKPDADKGAASSEPKAPAEGE